MFAPSAAGCRSPLGLTLPFGMQAVAKQQLPASRFLLSPINNQRRRSQKTVSWAPTTTLAFAFFSDLRNLAICKSTGIGLREGGGLKRFAGI